ncbi:hypothetical protein BLA29_009303, partial [Euroglyphus maynei]
MENHYKNYTLFHGYDSNTMEWRRVMIEYDVDDDYDSFIFIGKVNDIVAIDDITAVDYGCDYIRHNHDFCDFELNSTCMFDNVHNDFDEYWHIMNGSSIDPPIDDHTTHTPDGHVFGFIMDPKYTKIKATMVHTKPLSYQQPYCLRFSYYLTDNITLYYNRLSVHEKTVWRISGTTN